MREDFSLEYDKIFGQTCKRISGEGALRCDDGTESFEIVIVELEAHCLEFRVCADTDEVIYAISNKEGNSCRNSVDLFEEFNGNKLGYVWSANSWRGREEAREKRKPEELVGKPRKVGIVLSRAGTTVEAGGVQRPGSLSMAQGKGKCGIR